jgi:hypothetical protein
LHAPGRSDLNHGTGDLRDLPTWQGADGELRGRILDAAARYLTEGPVDGQAWSVVSHAGYRALRLSLASFLIIAALADDGAVTGLMGHSNIAVTRRLYAADWREAEERNEIVLRQLADAEIGQ